MPVSSSVTILVRGLFHVKHSGVGGLFALGGVGLAISVGIGAGAVYLLAVGPQTGYRWTVGC